MGLVPEDVGKDFLRAFSFSCQTFTAVGYGVANIVASIQALMGLLRFALSIVLVYRRFSYRCDEIKRNKKFVRPYQLNEEGVIVMHVQDIQDIHNTEAT